MGASITLAGLLEVNNQDDDAISLYEQTLAMLERTTENNHSNLAALNLALSLAQKSSKTASNEGIRKRKGRKETDSRALAVPQIMIRIAALHLKAGDGELAESSYREVRVRC
jgi:hypothetical protein